MGEGSSRDPLLEFVARATRPSRQGAYEHLLSQFLAQAVICTDPLKRVKVVCEACLMVSESERANLAINYEMVEVLNAVANSLLNVTVRKADLGFKENPQSLEVYSVPWSFPLTEENFNRYIKPWFTCQVWYYPIFLRKHVELGKDSFGYPKVKNVIKEPFWSLFFDVSNCLSNEGYMALRNAFSAWAMPTVQCYLAELTRVVSQDLYSQILGLYVRPKARRDYVEKVKESAEVLGREDSLEQGF